MLAELIWEKPREEKQIISCTEVKGATIHFGHLYGWWRPFLIKLKFDRENQLFVFKFTKSYQPLLEKYF